MGYLAGFARKTPRAPYAAQRPRSRPPAVERQLYFPARRLTPPPLCRARRCGIIRVQGAPWKFDLRPPPQLGWRADGGLSDESCHCDPGKPQKERADPGAARRNGRRVRARRQQMGIRRELPRYHAARPDRAGARRHGRHAGRVPPRAFRGGGSRLGAGMRRAFPPRGD